jgi:DNA (cytosine-5)-methyltransferase 1
VTKVLDLFCGGGGAAEGYLRAGWEVTGVDHSAWAVKGYPGNTVVQDAISYLREVGTEGFDIIHASPPCQGYSLHSSREKSQYVRDAGRNEPKLIPIVRSLLRNTGKPYIIENVTKARWEMYSPITLCGGMFGLVFRRHRLFETYPRLPDPLPGHRCVNLTEMAALLGVERQELSMGGNGRKAQQRDRWIKWLEVKLNPEMSRYQAKEAIPPAYTHFIAECFKELGI